MNDKISYEDAFGELNGIVADIERGEIPVDDLSAKVKRAALLINICKEKLTATEADVNDILKGLAAPTVRSQSVPPPGGEQVDDLPF